MARLSLAFLGQRLSRGAWLFILGCMVMLLLAFLWRFTPLNEYADPARVGRWARAWRHSDWAIPMVLLTYIAASLVMFPNTVLNVATVLTFGGLPGVALALSGSLLATSLFYVVGRLYGAERLRKRRGHIVERLSAAFRQSGLLGVISVRLMPVAPFTAVNLVAGASRVHPLNFFIGSAIGLAPGPIAVAFFGRQVRAALRDPGPVSIAWLALTVLIGGCGFYWLRREFKKRGCAADKAAEEPSQPGMAKLEASLGT